MLIGCDFKFSYVKCVKCCAIVQTTRAALKLYAQLHDSNFCTHSDHKRAVSHLLCTWMWCSIHVRFELWLKITLPNRRELVDPVTRQYSQKLMPTHITYNDKTVLHIAASHISGYPVISESVVASDSPATTPSTLMHLDLFMHTCVLEDAAPTENF